MANKPTTREEMLLNAVATGEVASIEPITREEMFLAKAAGMDVNTPEPITRKEMFLSKISGGSGSVDSEIVKSICEGAPYELTGDNVTFIADRAFANDNLISNVFLKNVTRIGQEAFRQSYVVTFYTPNLVSIGERALVSGRVTHFHAPKLDEIGLGAFQGCQSLEDFGTDAPAPHTIGESAFLNCKELSTEAANQLVRNIKTLEKNVFQLCGSIEKLDFPCVSVIKDGAFVECQKLNALILRNETDVCNVDFGALSGTPMPTLDGFIYVPTSMYEHYRTKYSDALEAAMGVPGVFDMLFRKIEDYPEICG